MLSKFAAPRTKWDLVCRDKHGKVKWQEKINNLVADEGINHLINAYFKGVNYTAQFYIGLLGSEAVIAATDKMASHTGWTEFTGYASAGRPALVLGPTGDRRADNSSNRAIFSFPDGGTVAGAFLTTSSIKGGTTGVLYSAALFTTGDKILTAGDDLAVIMTVAGA